MAREPRNQPNPARDEGVISGQASSQTPLPPAAGLLGRHWIKSNGDKLLARFESGGGREDRRGGWEKRGGDASVLFRKPPAAAINRRKNK